MSEKNSFKEELKRINADNEATATMSESLNAEMSAEPTESKKETVLDLMIKNKHITAEEAATWKETYDNKVFAVYLDDSESYVFRSIRFPEYKQVISQYTKSSLPAEEKDTLLDEMLIQRCLLYPKYTADFKLTCAAGIIPTLSKQIQYASNFIPDELAIRLIQKL